MHEDTQPWWEVAVGLVTLVVCGLYFFDSLFLPPPVFDSLGPARIPQITMIILAGFAIAITAQGIGKIRRSDPGARVPLDYRPRPWLAAGVYGLTAVYVLVLSTRVVHFSLATFVFLPAAGLMIKGLRLKPFLVLVLFGAVLGFGGQEVFTKIFYVDLP